MKANENAINNDVILAGKLLASEGLKEEEEEILQHKDISKETSQKGQRQHPFGEEKIKELSEIVLTTYTNSSSGNFQMSRGITRTV